MSQSDQVTNEARARVASGPANGSTQQQGWRPASAPKDFGYPAGTLSVEQAIARLLAEARRLTSTETVSLFDASGRVLYAECRSAIDVPGYDNSQMDGFAVRAVDLDAPLPVRLAVHQRIAAGQVGVALEAGKAARIFTGAALPEGADAVVAQEDCEFEEQRGIVQIKVSAKRGENVRPRGNDIARGSVVVPAGVRLRPQEIGTLASIGIPQLNVVARPRVAIISSGDELVAPGEPLSAGQIYNSNRYILHALLGRLGCDVMDVGIVADDLSATVDALRAAAQDTDLIVSSGGMSVGDEDHMRAALESIGALNFWRVAVKPGKPLALGRIGDADFLGLPGNPVSTLVTFCLFVRPFILRRMGCEHVSPRFFEVQADFDWPKAGSRREYARAKLTGEPSASDACAIALSGNFAQLHQRQGSDVLSATAWADGLVEIPEGCTVTRGDCVRYVPFVSLLD